LSNEEKKNDYENFEKRWTVEKRGERRKRNPCPCACASV
jgi:hypothetical protein